MDATTTTVVIINTAINNNISGSSDIIDEDVNHVVGIDENQNMAFEQPVSNQPPAYSQYPPPYPQGFQEYPQQQGFQQYPQQQGFQQYPQQQGYEPYPQQRGLYGQQANQEGNNVNQRGDADGKFGIPNHFNLSGEYLPHFEDPEVRRSFIRKVYSIVSIQMLFCFLCVFAVLYVEPIHRFFIENNTVLTWSFLIGYTVFIMTAYCCCMQMALTHPGDKIVLLIETILLTGFACAFSVEHKPILVAMSLGTTVLITALLTIVAFQSRIDFTRWYVVIMVAFFAVLFITIFAMLLLPLIVDVDIPLLGFVVSCVVVILLCCFIVIDTQMLMKNKEYSLSPSMPWFAAGMIFSDIILLFMYILRIFSYLDCCN